MNLFFSSHSKLCEGIFVILTWNLARIILDWWNCKYQVLTLHNLIAILVYEDVGSIYALKTTILSNPKLQI